MPTAVPIVCVDSPVSAPNTGLTAQLRENERIWAGFRDLELRMLAADSLHDILHVVTHELPIRFPAVQVVTIAWNNPQALCEQIDLEEEKANARACLVVNPQAQGPELVIRRPHLGRLELAMQRRYFPRYPRPLGSMAIAPLFLRGEYVGSLNQGSEDPDHFTHEAATDLLEHLAAVTAICIDNAFNRACLEHQGLTDALTNVGNRRFFEQRLREEVSLWQRHGGELSCLLIDLDLFKRINDQHGHPVGDLVLQQSARSFSQGLRASDVLARYGGEEFALLLPATDATRAFEIAERLRATLAATCIAASPDTSLRVTASIGLASLGRQSTPTDEPGAWLLHQADVALYAAKARGRNSVVSADAMMEI